jgi:quinohemoprotein ethanol dehydrogenase
MALAAKTWNRRRPLEFKGGGTVWDGFAYDPDLMLVYFGTANAAPYDLRQLGGKPKDTLFTDSIVALHADTGHLAWYYQTTPGDHWDFDACQKLVLADLKIGNVTRPIIMQANKNGFFYVLDRRTGKLISAKNFTFVNWASRIDKKTGRPRLTKQANWYSGPKVVYPSWAGGHSWPPTRGRVSSISRSSMCPVSGLICCITVDGSNSSTASSPRSASFPMKLMMQWR